MLGVKVRFKEGWNKSGGLNWDLRKVLMGL